MMKAAPADYMDRVIPSDPNHSVYLNSSSMIAVNSINLELGCKRVIYDTNYLASLARPNVSVVWDPIEAINEDSILTTEGD
jgi:cation diffusion facilitator CzcD-associated flavoprotein CzcO